MGISMISYIDLDLELAAELGRARENFCNAAADNEQLLLLLLINPIQAFADAEIELSARARQYIRNVYPGRAYENIELYEAVRDGRVRLPWIKGIRLRRATPSQQEQTQMEFLTFNYAFNLFI